MKYSRERGVDAVIVEPVQKWHFPHEIKNLAACPDTSGCSYAVALSVDHELYNWTPTTGFYFHSGLGMNCE